MGLYTKLPDEIENVDVIVAGGRPVAATDIRSENIAHCYMQVARQAACWPHDSQKPIPALVSS